jgi:hypothetical protein
MITVLYVNNEGGGFAESKPVDNGTTFGDFITRNVGGDTSGYRIRLNNVIAQHTTVLKNGDRVVVTPIKVDGGCVL